MREDSNNDSAEETPVTVEQIAAAMTALGAYHGANTPAEHAAEAARLGGPDAYRVRMVNALLGIVQAVCVGQFWPRMFGRSAKVGPTPDETGGRQENWP